MTTMAVIGRVVHHAVILDMIDLERSCARRAHTERMASVPFMGTPVLGRDDHEIYGNNTRSGRGGV